MNKPTVLQVVRTYLPPTENWIYEQVIRVQHYRSVFACRKISKLEQFPFEAVRSASENPVLLQLLDRLLTKRRGYSPFFSDVAVSEDARIIHAHGGGIATTAVHVANHLNLPLVVSFYGTDMWTHPDGVAGLQRKYNHVFRTGTLFLAEGPAAADQLMRIGCPPQRIVLHRLGVDVRAIPFSPRVLADGSRLQVLMASRFVEKKGIPYGVEAFCRVAKDNPGLGLTIVGQGNSKRDRVLTPKIRQIASRHGVSEQVKIRRFMPREELLAFADNFHVFLHPSVQAANGDSEGGHPVVMTMLAASGMPIVATRHCDIPEVVHDRDTGWLVAEKDVDALEETLREIVRDPSPIRPFGENARRLVAEKYDISAMLLDPIYDSIANLNESVTLTA